MKYIFYNRLLLLCFVLTLLSCGKKSKSSNGTDSQEMMGDETALHYEGTQMINIAESKIMWTGKKRIGENHIGSIDFKSGELAFEQGMLTSGSFTVNMASIVVLDEDMKDGDRQKLKEHLLATDFFDLVQYPISSFNITSVAKTEEGHQVTGNITIKGITKEISFPYMIKEGKFTASLSVDRTFFGIKYGSDSFFDNLGDKIIENDFDLEIALVIE